MQHRGFAPATRPATATVVERLAAAVRTWWHSQQAKRRQRQTVRILQGLDDRILKDIGLNRSEIESIAATGAGDRRLRYSGGAAPREARP
jgi:uncharacterized protein YjiS (DUF1127 family)